MVADDSSAKLARQRYGLPNIRLLKKSFRLSQQFLHKDR